MATYGELKPILGEMARYLRIISNAQCGTPSTSTLTGGTGNVPAGFNSITITAVTVPATLTFADATTYSLATVGESFSLSAAEGGSLPAFTVTAGTIKWLGRK